MAGGANLIILIVRLHVPPPPTSKPFGLKSRRMTFDPLCILHGTHIWSLGGFSRSMSDNTVPGTGHPSASSRWEARSCTSVAADPTVAFVKKKQNRANI